MIASTPTTALAAAVAAEGDCRRSWRKGRGGGGVDEAAERRAAVRIVSRRIRAAPFPAPLKSIHMKLSAFASRQARDFLRMSLNSFGPLISLRLRSWRSSSVADGSLIRSICWAAISDAFAAPFGAGSLR